MSESHSFNPADATPEQMHSALFANLVLQQSSAASIFLGRVPNPETGQANIDLEAAKLFIDTLEMLQAKTKGNLSQEEERLLQQTLMSLRLAFVEAVEKPAPQEQKPAAEKAAAPPSATPTAQPAPEKPGKAAGQPDVAAAPEEAPGEAESRKKFSKKY